MECSDELEAEARRVAERLEAEFDGKLLADWSIPVAGQGKALKVK